MTTRLELPVRRSNGTLRSLLLGLTSLLLLTILPVFAPPADGQSLPTGGLVVGGSAKITQTSPPSCASTNKATAPSSIGTAFRSRRGIGSTSSNPPPARSRLSRSSGRALLRSSDHCRRTVPWSSPIQTASGSDRTRMSTSPGSWRRPPPCRSKACNPSWPGARRPSIRQERHRIRRQRWHDFHCRQGIGGIRGTGGGELQNHPGAPGQGATRFGEPLHPRFPGRWTCPGRGRRQGARAGIGSDGKPLGAAVVNSGKILADGGTVLINASAVKSAIDNVIDMSGAVEARGARVEGGDIVLTGGRCRHRQRIRNARRFGARRRADGRTSVGHGRDGRPGCDGRDRRQRQCRWRQHRDRRRPTRLRPRCRTPRRSPSPTARSCRRTPRKKAMGATLPFGRTARPPSRVASRQRAGRPAATAA